MYKILSFLPINRFSNRLKFVPNMADPTSMKYSVSRLQLFSKPVNGDYLTHTIFQFEFDLNVQLCVFPVKSPSVTQRSVSQENALKRAELHYIAYRQMYIVVYT